MYYSIDSVVRIMAFVKQVVDHWIEEQTVLVALLMRINLNMYIAQWHKHISVRLSLTLVR